MRSIPCQGGGHPRHKAWLDGRVLDPEQATVSIFTQTALRGANVYEGLRAYWSEERHNLYVWKLDPHLRRLFQSMKIMRMVPPYTAAELQQGVLDWIRANSFREDIHFRLVVYFGDGGNAGVRSYKAGEIDFGALSMACPACGRRGFAWARPVCQYCRGETSGSHGPDDWDWG